jgi:hypothetical protein
MLRRVFQFRNWLLLEGSVSRYMKKFPNVKETYTSDGKIPGKGDLFRIHFSRNVQKKLQKGTIKERLLKLSLVLLNKVFLAMKTLRITTLNG